MATICYTKPVEMLYYKKNWAKIDWFRQFPSYDNMAAAILDVILNFSKSSRWIFGDFWYVYKYLWTPFQKNTAGYECCPDINLMLPDNV